MRPLNPGSAVLASVLASVLAPSSVQADAPPGRYTAVGKTVVDNVTHLTWQQTVATNGGDDGAGRSTWANAKTSCATLGGGYRLPTAKELLTLIDFSKTSPAIDTSAGAFPDTPSEPFWTATPLRGSPPASAWFIDFSDGYTGNADMTQPSRVRCVR